MGDATLNNSNLNVGQFLVNEESNSLKHLPQKQDKFYALYDLLKQICKYKASIKKLQNHPVHFLVDFLKYEIPNLDGFLIAYTEKEVAELMYDFKGSRNKEFLGLIKKVSAITTELADTYADTEMRQSFQKISYCSAIHLNREDLANIKYLRSLV